MQAWVHLGGGEVDEACKRRVGDQLMVDAIAGECVDHGHIGHEEQHMAPQRGPDDRAKVSKEDARKRQGRGSRSGAIWCSGARRLCGYCGTSSFQT